MDLSISGSGNHDETVCRGEAQQNYRAAADSSCFRIAYRIVKVFCRVNPCCIISCTDTGILLFSKSTCKSGWESGPRSNMGFLSWAGVTSSHLCGYWGFYFFPWEKPDNSLCAGCGTLLFFL